jgi:guanylate kinase
MKAEGASYKDIAKALRRSESAIANRLNKLKEEVRKEPAPKPPVVNETPESTTAKIEPTFIETISFEHVLIAVVLFGMGFILGASLYA